MRDSVQGPSSIEAGAVPDYNLASAKKVPDSVGVEFPLRPPRVESIRPLIVHFRKKSFRENGRGSVLSAGVDDDEGCFGSVRSVVEALCESG